MADTISDNNEPVARHNSRENLERFLSQMIEQPERREAIALEIASVFGQDKAILVLDMSGFSRTTHRHGIVYFLLMIHQMRLLASPCIAKHAGIVVKAEADNLFCLFDTVGDAVRAAREITQRLDTVNLVLPEDRRLYASIGIGYGHVLNIEDKDLFGNEVNLASKLGEDVAAQGAILLTPQAHANVEDAGIETHEEMISIAGLSLSYYIIER